MSRHAAERLVWAVEQLAPTPGERILEVGCGHGVAVSLVCERVGDGHVTAIDRSPKMVALAAKRNAAWVAAGRASFVTGDVADVDLDLGGVRSDAILAVHLGVFSRGEPARQLAAIRRLLAPGGPSLLGDQPLDPAALAATLAAVGERLERHGFAVVERCRGAVAGGPIGAVVAKAAPSS